MRDYGSVGIFRSACMSSLHVQFAMGDFRIVDNVCVRDARVLYYPKGIVFEQCAASPSIVSISPSLPYIKNHMPRRRRHLPRLPHPLLPTHPKHNLPAVRHDPPRIAMLEPIPPPRHPVDRHALHVEPLPALRLVQALGAYAQRAVVVHRDVDVVEPGALEQVHGRRDDGIQAEHLPDQPAVERAGVRVAGDAAGRVGVEVGGQLAGALYGLPLLVQVVVQVRRLEVGLVGDVVDGRDAQAVDAQVDPGRVGLEHVVQPLFEVLCAAHEFYHALYVVGDDEGVLWSTVSFARAGLAVHVSPKAVPS